MTKAVEFSLAYLEAHPAGAARVFEEITPSSGAEFAEQVPAELLAPALAQMDVSGAVDILVRCSATTTAEILTQMAPNARAILLRALPMATKDGIFAALPRREAATLRRYLSYDPGTAGAWMTAPKAVTQADMTVAQSLQRLRKLREKPGTRLFVVGQDKKLSGTVDVDALLVADDNEIVASLMQADPVVISPHTPLASAVRLEAWDTSLVLPVTDKSGRLLGVLSFDDVRDGLATDRGGDAPKSAAMLFQVGEALMVSLTGVLQAAASTPATRIGGDIT